MRVRTGDATTFRAMTFGVASRETFDYLDQMGLDFNSSISGEAKLRFDEVKDVYKAVTFDDALDALRNAIEGADLLALPNRIMPLVSLAELQHAPDVMIPWIMAHPTLREKYNSNACEGYGDRFLDFFGDALGDSYPLYKAAVNGLRREVGDEWKMELFAEVRAEKDLQIDMRDQLAIMDTWSEIDYQLSLNDRDPTSPFNCKL